MLIYTKQIYRKYARELKGLTGATVLIRKVIAIIKACMHTYFKFICFFLPINKCQQLLKLFICILRKPLA